MSTEIRPPVPRLRFEDLRPTERRRWVVRALLEPLAGGAAVFVLYFVLPLNRELNAGTVVILASAMVATIGLVAWQVRRIINAKYPRLRAIGALATTVPLFLVIFSTTYYFIARGQTGAFTETLNRTDALYFTVTVFSTVGFGDIAPKTEAARVVAIVQMLGDLALLGLLGKVLLGAATIGLQRARAGGGTADEERE